MSDDTPLGPPDAFLDWARPLLALSRSQILQDLWVMWTLGAPRTGFVLDIGAADGVHLSNSWLLERLGWRGLLVEPNPRFAASIAAQRAMPHDARAVGPRTGERLAFHVVRDFPELSRLAEGMPTDSHDRRGARDDVETVVVDTVTAADLLAERGCPALIDYLSLDVEGAELLFLETLDWSRVRFRCLTVEHNLTPNRRAIHDLLTAQGYVRVWEELSWFDDWYVAAEAPDWAAVEAGRAAFTPRPESYIRFQDVRRDGDHADRVDGEADVQAMSPERVGAPSTEAQGGTTDPGAFRRLAAFAPSDGSTRCIELELPAGTTARLQPFVSLLTVDGDLLLNIEVEPEQRRVAAAQRFDGVWSGRIEYEAATGEEGLKLSIEVLPGGGVSLGLSGGVLFAWDAPRGGASLAAIDGMGFWTVAHTTLASTGEDTRTLVAAETPSRGLSGALFDDLVYDIGANNGDDTDFYLAKGFRVVAVDADPALCARVAERFAGAITDGRLTLINAGVAPVRGRLTFYVNEVHDEWSSFDREIASRGHPVREVIVPTVTPDDLLDAFGVPRYLKIDIEGYDAVMVRAAAANPVKPTFLSFENGALDLFEALVAAGYDSFQIVNQAHVTEARCPVPAREGLTVEHCFPRGSSGPFGRDLPEKAWLGVPAMRQVLTDHLARVAQRPDSETGEWFDLHASISNASGIAPDRPGTRR